MVQRKGKSARGNDDRQQRTSDGRHTTQGGQRTTSDEGSVRLHWSLSVKPRNGGECKDESNDGGTRRADTCEVRVHVNRVPAINTAIEEQSRGRELWNQSHKAAPNSSKSTKGNNDEGAKFHFNS